MEKNNEKIGLGYMNIRHIEKALLVENLCSFLEPEENFLIKVMPVPLWVGGRNERCTQARLEQMTDQMPN